MAKSSQKASVRTPIEKRKGHPQTNPNSLANLKPPWKPGEGSPNPGGRPKSLSSAYKKMLDSKFPPELIAGAPNLQLQIKHYAGEQDCITYADKIALSQGMAAATGDTSAARELRAATEGESINVNDAAFEEYMQRLQMRFSNGRDDERAEPA